MTMSRDTALEEWARRILAGETMPEEELEALGPVYGWRLLRWEADIPLPEEQRAQLQEYARSSMRMLGVCACREEDEDAFTLLVCCTQYPAKTHRDVALWLCMHALTEKCYLMLEQEGFADKVCEALKLERRPADLRDWNELVDRFLHPQREVTIALVGKYIQLHDAYLSVVEALRHGGIAHRARVNIRWVQADDLTAPGVNLDEIFEDVQGILVPGGFGNRGIEGKMLAARYAREHKIPYLGICLGMQVAVIEFARHVAGLEGADSTEFTPDAADPVIDLMPDQQGKQQTGGTMRLGRYDCRLKEGTRARALYGEEFISERHRHRYEFNNAYRELLERAGMAISGVNPQRNLVEIIELPDHPWFVACQYHPEFKSRPNRPHPLFAGLVGAALHL